MSTRLRSGDALATCFRSTRRAVLFAALAAVPLIGTVHQSAFAAVDDSASRRAVVNAAATKQERFFQTYAADAVASTRATGVPASVTLAQAALESAWGQSRLATQANNFFGIKALGRTGSSEVVWMKTWEVVQGRNVSVSQPFRAYASAAESFADHGRFFLRNSRYARALAVKHDAKAFAREIAKAGYATDPSYAQKLIRLMDRYNLYRFDVQAG